MSADDDSAQVEIGVAYRNLPARAPRPVDIGRDTLERQIQSGVFAGKPVLDNHQQEARIGQVLDAWIAPTRSAGDVLMVEYEIDRRSERGRKIGDQVREGVLPHLSLGHNMETGNVEELSVVQEGYRQGTQTMRLPRTLDQRPKTKQDKLMFYASKAEALAMLAQDGTWQIYTL